MPPSLRANGARRWLTHTNIYVHTHTHPHTLIHTYKGCDAAAPVPQRQPHTHSFSLFLSLSFSLTHTHTHAHTHTRTKAVMLRHLWLNGNRLSVAPRMSLCPLLQTLNLSDNQLVYPPSLGGFGVVCSNVLQCVSVRRA